ncbi:MAG: hypothetical protein KGR98_07555 [Verrucomicrobia bacterium]|nr:hypothetical protein [Verrucomicrobiota bacterium]
MPSFDKDSCYAASGKFCACIEFHLPDDKRRGFHTSQLIEYTLEANPDAEDDKNAPPQKFALAFSTADVVILGWRLGLLADKLQENDLAAVRALPKRYADVDRHTPFVASITVTSIDAEKPRNSPK